MRGDDAVLIPVDIERERELEAGLIRQAAKAEGDPLLEELDVSEDEAQRIADGLVGVGLACWRLGVHSTVGQLERTMTDAG
jgi:hypothetical protein